MRFKSIEVTGFKSFAERTKVNFQRGITAIVGPNGCGKSNVSDAIRWVLGEQSAKQIRGEKMEDLIFSGTRSRAPMGMAEVNLVVTDLDPNATNDFSVFDEIQITRRYYRSGDSEYLINRIPCRLSDIRELFMDTGMGAKAYSIISQESITSILNAKPKERRYLFEEAAGISKYKARKDEALRKLERTQDNLSRVRDIIAEVTRQRNSLNRQAKKAERYKKYRKEIREVELHLSSHDYASLQEEWNNLEKQFAENKRQETELLTLSTAKETQIEDLELDVLDREKALGVLRDEVREVESKITAEENRIEVLNGNIAHLFSTTEGAEKEIRRLQEEIIEIEKNIARLEDERRVLAARNAEQEETLREKLNACDARRAVRDEKEQVLENEKNRLFELKQQISVLQNRIENLIQRQETLIEEHRGYDRNRTEQMELLAGNRRRLTEKEENLRTKKDRMEAVRSEYDAILHHLEEKQESLSVVMETVSRLREQIGQENSRLETLQELQENMEDYDDGIRTLVRETSTAENTDLPHFHSFVADLFESDPKVETAIEAAISNRYQSLVIDDLDDALRSVAHLKKHQIGRGSFIPLQPKLRERAPFVPREGAGIVGEALQLVRFAPEYRGVAEYLLGDVVVMENLDQAVSLFRTNGFRRTLVTLNGEILDPSGAIEGGISRQKGGGFIRRKREIRELTHSLASLKTRLQQAVEERDGLQQEIAAIRQQKGELFATLEKMEQADREEEKEIASLHHEAEYLERKIESLAREDEIRSREIESIREHLALLRSEGETLEEKQKLLESSTAALLQEIGELRAGIEEQRKTITEARIKIAADRERNASLDSHAENSRRNLENLRNLITARRREIEEAQRRIVQVKEEKTATETKIHHLIDKQEEVRTRLAAEQDLFENRRDELHGEQEAFKELRRRTETLTRDIYNLGVRRTEQSMKMEQLHAKIEERYQIDLEEIFSSYQEKELDRPVAAERLDELNRKIDQMGAVNIMAIEEFNELQERFDFLSEQETDLQESVNSLMAAIRKINRTSRQRFQEAFDAINEKFKTVFTTLFQGGQAELKLDAGEDVLDAGIDIIVQPPGKKLQQLSLLSGGEKALTAVALIFAGFLVKPSPFCLLDEVDAPMDDTNVNRYTEMIKEMSEKTQFIVITHNKNTMEQADALYGITMQEPGVSKMVSVRFNDGHEAQMTA
ncbi:MAG: chromosome segregation protein SMC [Deltaproteobacteria bacterium]|nr:chromosome segregation protein SMC [Deltaproteobacteria bacterium]